MPHQSDIHPVQVHILRSLLYATQAGYAELQKHSGLDSDHFNFHIKKLIVLGYVSKGQGSTYSLTTIGKEHANKLNHQTHTIERQAKVSVILGIIQQAEGQPDRVLVQQRHKHPFYGYWALPGGKLHWGETIAQAAQRQLLEETGLTCDLEIANVYHKIDISQDNQDLLEDKILFSFLGTNPQGQLIDQFEGGQNVFMTVDQIKDLDKAFNGLDSPLTKWLHQDRIRFDERHHFYTTDQY